MAATLDPKLAKAKAEAKAKKTPATKTLFIGDKSDVHLEVKITKATGKIANLEAVGAALDDLDVGELQDLVKTVFGKSTRVRSRGKLISRIEQFLADLETQYEKQATKSKKTKKEKKPVAKKKKAKKIAKKEKPVVEPTPPPKSTGAEVGQRWPKTYQGAHFELVAVDGGFRLDGPDGHKAVGKVYGSATAAGKAITSYTNMNGRKFFGMDASERSPRGRRGPQRRHLKPRDPRLPMPSETFCKYHGDKKFVIEVLDGDHFKVTEEDDDGRSEVGTFDSISAAATAISDCQENGYRFFGLNHRVGTLDPWMALVAVLHCQLVEYDEASRVDQMHEMIRHALGECEGTEDLDLQPYVDALARAFYKANAVEAAMASMPKAKEEEEEEETKTEAA